MLHQPQHLLPSYSPPPPQGTHSLLCPSSTWRSRLALCCISPSTFSAGSPEGGSDVITPLPPLPVLIFPTAPSCPPAAAELRAESNDCLSLAFSLRMYA